MAINLTVGIPVFNSAATIKAVLDRLTMMRMPGLKVFVHDDGSYDGTRGMLGELAGTKYFQRKHAPECYPIDLHYFIGTHQNLPKPEAALRVRRLIAEVCQTEFLFFLDSDVILPPNALQELLDDFEKTDAMFMGIRYEPDAAHNHVMFGATIWRAADFRRLPTTFNSSKDGCECSFATRWAAEQKRPAKFHRRLTAYHCKQF